MIARPLPHTALPQLDSSASPEAEGGWSGLGLAELVACLRGRGLACRIAAAVLFGESDLRLQVRRPGGEVAAELLGPGPHGGGWQAVRVAGENRVVWQLVEGEGATAVAGFLSDLVSLPPAVLHGRYARLG